VTLKALSRTNARVHVLDAPPGDHTLSTVAQLARLLVALALPFHPDDYLLVVIPVRVFVCVCQRESE
jgi:hypothetical protein